MKRTLLAVTLVLAGAGVLVAIAQERRGERRGGEEGARRRRVRTPAMGRGGVSLAEAVSRLDLSPQKQARVNKILKDAGAAAEEDREKNAKAMAELREELNKAREEGDREARRALFTKMRELRGGRGQAQAELIKKLEPVLGEADFAKLQEAMRSPGRAARMSSFLQAVGQLNLNLKQQKQVDKTLDAAVEKIKRGLTPDQRDKLKQAVERSTRRRAPRRAAGGRRGRAADRAE